ncbi:conserved exported hypothetical protein [Paraburkholderia piptadeniae]|uniref:Haemolysin activator HlyB C-terminal domain-containing protein n=1 Tax=Paraburkholderia piptadeniae TaxID=1701573 RepID=A0A1N7SI97_9BURK|nr:ShlB/FhaC/HecB family hemolysin secretion/activation protein [Paraburkholderia piptadeniae]SIT47134.1 conserved exported hypothetical protein [Paraburkholderia piptadeniae]
MSARKNNLGITIGHTLCAGSLILAGLVNAEPVATVSASPVAQAPVTVKVVPAGGGDAIVVTQLMNAEISKLGSAPKTLDEVNRWSDVLTAAMRQGGFPIATVLMTDDDWRIAQNGGVAKFTVFPGRIRQITVKNKSRVADARLQRLITHALCGKETIEGVCLLRTARLERTTELLQDVPGVAIESAPHFAPGADVGDANVVFSIAELGKPVSADLIMDNKGIPSTGSYRFGMTASANNYFRAGESYAFTLMATDKKMWTGSITGSMPILDDGLRVTGGFTRQQYSINTVAAMTGVANVAQAGVLFPFTRGLDRNVWGGVSLLHSQTGVDMGPGYPSQHSKIDSVQLLMQADNGDRAKQLRTNIWSAQGALTLGHERNDSFADDVTHVSGNYAKLTANTFATYGLNPSGDLFLSGRVNGQLASRNLDASEKLGIGGPDAVRAYRADEGSLDDGAVVNLGLYKRIPVAVGHQLQAGVFTDFAYGRVNHSPWPNWELSYPGVPGVTNSRLLAGYGLSLDWLTPIGATVSASVSKPFGFSSPSWVDPGKKPVQYWLSVTWNH